ncbi:hypothetical protein MNEG_12215 [Monoraphidium neglectum]|uniref:Uncharacterized protein n=1 Tax=Monoraphidium neglectum TaxID=145388 RepID=A0A0D2M340_9CHLO|nr:hypothetical protein MNEG_12215 [Monoraphidium neglectum]KIY95746.1 hypothetical protein MNEG_12215 [Monoraphidium neglectum]|eukprot:XP_013894766.1 hypothetical protein MNEG_12215 [Monoraphidium neglectum]
MQQQQQQQRQQQQQQERRLSTEHGQEQQLHAEVQGAQRQGQQLQQSARASADTPFNLVPCASEWAPPGGEALCQALEGDAPPSDDGGAFNMATPDDEIAGIDSLDADALASDGGSGASEAPFRLWTQKSIVASARDDLTRFAAMQGRSGAVAMQQAQHVQHDGLGWEFTVQQQQHQHQHPQHQHQQPQPRHAAATGS